MEIFGTQFCRAEIELYFFDRAPEIFREYFGVLEFWHDRETVVGADVHACVRGEPERHAMFHFCFGLLLAVDEEAACAAGAELAGFIGCELVAHIDFARGQRVARTDGVQFQSEQAVGMLEIVRSRRKAKSRLENWTRPRLRPPFQDAARVPAPAGIVEVRADAVRTIVDRRDHAGRNVFGSVVVRDFVWSGKPLGKPHTVAISPSNGST